MSGYTKRGVAWSCGGGLQSVAIGVLIREGVLPRPDWAGIADTGRERRTTWQYLRDVLQPYLDPVGVTVHVIPHSLARVDLYAPTSDKPLVPAYTRSEGEMTLWGEPVVREGRLPSFCSGEWKRDVFERWLRLQGVLECDAWIGYSTDEKERAAGKKDHRPWCRYRYPLLDLGLSRTDCVRLIEKAGLPQASKSRCYDCPHQDDAEWLQVRSDPEEWALAVERDEAIREADEQGGLYLHHSRVPLKMADLTPGAGMPARPCESGHCWT